MKRLSVIVLFVALGCGRGGPFGGTGGGSGGNGGGATGGGSAGGGATGGGVGGGTAGGSAGGGTGGGSTSSCDGLDFASCVVRPDCVADMCMACSCTPLFGACRAATAAPFQCPVYDCAQPFCCRQRGECSSSADCVPPGTPSACGACLPDPGDCTTDSECASGAICNPMACSCNGATHCEPGCGASNPCQDGLICSGGAHPRCVTQGCAEISCPPGFSCDAQGACQRKTCTTDRDCDASGTSYCVLGECHLAYGECRYPVP